MTDYKLLTQDLEAIEAPLRQPPSRSYWLTISSHIAALLLGVAIYQHISSTIPLLSSKECPSSRPPDVYTTVPERLLPYSKIVRTNGSFDFPSIYRGRGPEVDRAWNELIEVGTLNLDATASDLTRFGISEETVAQYPKEEGGRYMLSIEVYHQLHCVNLLRRVTHWNFDYYDARPEENMSFKFPDQLATHVDHCLEILRQTLMCQADPTIISYHRVSFRTLPWPDFSTVHQCRDFETIHKWAKSIERESQAPPARVPGAPQLTTPP